MNDSFDPAPRDDREDGHDDPRSAMTLTPVYRWLIMLNLVLSAVSLALGVAAAVHTHAAGPARSVLFVATSRAG